MTALLFAAAALAGDISAVVGTTRTVPAPAEEDAAGPTFGVIGGGSVHFDQLRIEGQLLCGRSPESGVEAVNMDGWRLGISALAGYRGTWIEAGKLDLGLDALIGPSLIYRGIHVEVQNDHTVTKLLQPRLTAAVGPWVAFGPVVLSGRVQVTAPIEPHVHAYASLGVRF